MLSLAVFYFVFLGTEYLFDNRVALYTDPGNPTAFKAAGFFLPVPVIADSLICLPCAALAACFLR